MRCMPETQAVAGMRISNRSADRLRYFGRGFFAAAVVMRLEPVPRSPRGTPRSDSMVEVKEVQVPLRGGARRRGPGMERKDLLEANGKIFGPQGQALDRVADRNVKVLVVGNPANTNCLIAMKNAPSLKPAQFTGMMRLDHNRATSQISQKISKPVTAIRKITVWGNHSATQYPDIFQAEVDGKKVWPMINDQAWLEATVIPTVQKRGAA